VASAALLSPLDGPVRGPLVLFSLRLACALAGPWAGSHFEGWWAHLGSGPADRQRRFFGGGCGCSPCCLAKISGCLMHRCGCGPAGRRLSGVLQLASAPDLQQFRHGG